MTIDDNIRDEKLQYINGEAAERPLSSGKIDKYECFNGKEILPVNPSQMTDEAEFAYSPQRKKLLKNKQEQLKIKGKSGRINAIFKP